MPTQEPLISSPPSQSLTNTHVDDCSMFSIVSTLQADNDRLQVIRNSNSLFTQLMICEFCSVFFAILGLILAVIAEEIKIYNKKTKVVLSEFHES